MRKLILLSVMAVVLLGLIGCSTVNLVPDQVPATVQVSDIIPVPVNVVTNEIKAPFICDEDDNVPSRNTKIALYVIGLGILIVAIRLSLKVK